MLTWPVAEKFVSINGEGAHAGFPAAFIRFKGCNLSCSYCDTAWANAPDCPVTEEGEEDLLGWLSKQGVRRVTLTGGEPLLVKGAARLIEVLGRSGCRVEIETNGSIDIRPFSVIEPRPVFTLDYKCPGSGMEDHMLTSNYDCLADCDSVKFVITDRRDLDCAKRICDRYRLPDRCQVFLSASFTDIEPRDIVDYMISRGWQDVRLQLQMHKYIWPPEMRGV